MEIRFNVERTERQKLVGAISELIDAPAKYKGAPSFAYEVGGFVVNKESTVFFDPSTDPGMVQTLMTRLAERGFEMESLDRLTIEVPREGFTEQALENLEKLVASKASLIKKAIGADDLSIEQTETTLKFPWFPLATGDEVEAYTLLIHGLCKVAKERKRINAKEKPVENEKFAFRVFLIQLGFVGDEYKAARKILLKKLTGNSAFRYGSAAKAEVEGDE
jgi:hypothetical protein